MKRNVRWGCMIAVVFALLGGMVQAQSGPLGPMPPQYPVAYWTGNTPRCAVDWWAYDAWVVTGLPRPDEDQLYNLLWYDPESGTTGKAFCTIACDGSRFSGPEPSCTPGWVWILGVDFDYQNRMRAWPTSGEITWPLPIYPTPTAEPYPYPVGREAW